MTKVDLHIHISVEDKLLVNPERIKLLRCILNTGSLLKASAEMGISYNKAWKLMDAINSVSEKPVIEKARGGSGGGGAILTQYGQFILKEYEAIEHVVGRFEQKLNTEINL